MGGRRRDFDGSFAVVEVSFILADPRLDGLKASQKWLYLTLWVLAVKERSNPLQPYYNSPATLARLCREDVRTIRPAISKLQQKGLIVINEDESITVCGVENKHKNLAWKDVPIKDVMPPHKGPQKEKEKEKEKKPPNPPKGAAVSPPEFETFWTNFPKTGGSRSGKPNAVKKWIGLMAEGITPEHLTECMENYREELTVEDWRRPMAVAKFLGPNREFEEFAPGKWTRPDPPSTNRPASKEEEVRFLNDPIPIPDDWRERK